MAHPAQAERHQLPQPERKRTKASRYHSRAKAMVEQAAVDVDAPIKWPTDIRLALDELTPKMRRFTILLACEYSQRQAYRMAYDISENSPDTSLDSDASYTKAHPKVSLALSLLREWLDRGWLLEANDAIETCLSKLYEEAEESDKSSVRVAATIAIMKYHGAFVSRSEVRHIHTIDSKTDQLLSTISELIGLAVPKPLPQIEQASVASIEFSDSE